MVLVSNVFLVKNVVEHCLRKSLLRT